MFNYNTYGNGMRVSIVAQHTYWYNYVKLCTYMYNIIICTTIKVDQVNYSIL